MKSGVILFLLLLCIDVRSQDFFAAPMQGMGNTGLAVPSVYGLTANGAGISRILKPQIAVAYQPHFLTNDLQAQALFFALPLSRSNSIGLSINTYGLKGVSSLLTLKAIYARSFGEYFSASISSNYHQYHVKGYGGDKSFSLDLGGHFLISQQLSLGLLLRNVSSSHFDDTIEQYINREVALGLLYQFSKELLLTADLYYNALYEVDPRIGIAYAIDNLLTLRAGTTLHPMQYFAGIGITLGKVVCDISSSFHTRIGSAPQISLVYGF